MNIGLPDHHIYNGDCIELMRSWCGQFRADLIFCDPPYNIGQPYLAHDDNMSSTEFVDFTTSWIDLTASLLKPNGVLAVLIPDSMVGIALSICPLQRIDWIIWTWRFGQCGRSKFISAHAHILVYRKGFGKHTWNADDILVESDRSSKYNDIRTLESETPGMRVPLDVWEIPRVVGNSKERVPECPNQVPEKVLDRVIRAYSNRGDCVFDPFSGSFSTAAVAAKLGRWSVSMEKSERLCELGLQRLQRAVAEHSLITV